MYYYYWYFCAFLTFYLIVVHYSFYRISNHISTPVLTLFIQILQYLRCSICLEVWAYDIYQWSATTDRLVPNFALITCCCFLFFFCFHFLISRLSFQRSAGLIRTIFFDNIIIETRDIYVFQFGFLFCGDFFVIPPCKTPHRQESFSPRTISDWNLLLMSRSVETFKAAVSSMTY